MLALSLSLSLLLSPAANAGSKVVLLQAPGTPTPDIETVMDSATRRLHRDGLSRLDADLPEGLPRALWEDVRVCIPLDPEQTAPIAAVAGDDELYVAMSFGKRARDTHFWRWDAGIQHLMAVVPSGRLAPLPQERGPATVLIAHGTERDATQLAEELGYSTLTVTALDDGARLSDQLMDHPFECIPPIDDELRQTLIEAGAAGDPTFVAYRHHNIRRLWRWSHDTQQLVRVMTESQR
jgi:hypothetical protein